MRFAKFHALGNDFILVGLEEGTGYRISQAELARSICDRHTGVGADGLVVYQRTASDPEADFSALIFNADGSRAEMSGNGVRCLAAHLHDSGRSSEAAIRLRTVSGIRVLELKDRTDGTFRYEASMGLPITEPSRIPVRLGGVRAPVLDYPLDVGGETVAVNLVSMGNPHCSIFSSDVSAAAVERLGPALERHAAFPNGTNVEFVQVIDLHRIRVRFWERGVGRTLSSGTGSSAAAVAAMLDGRAASPVTVETELGALEVSWNPGRELRLTGTAERVCTGEYSPPPSISRS